MSVLFSSENSSLDAMIDLIRRVYRWWLATLPLSKISTTLKSNLFSLYIINDVPIYDKILLHSKSQVAVLKQSYYMCNVYQCLLYLILAYYTLIL